MKLKTLVLSFFVLSVFVPEYACGYTDSGIGEELLLVYQDPLVLLRDNKGGGCLYNFKENEKWSLLPDKAVIEKALTYDKYTLEDEYEYKDTHRRFQWDKIKIYLNLFEHINESGYDWAVLQNYKNKNDLPPLVEETSKNDHNMVTDMYGVARYQSVPLYSPEDKIEPDRYARDGSLVRLVSGEEDGFYKIENTNFCGEWYVPSKYVKPIPAKEFRKVIFVDRRNQNITVLENVGEKWLVRSMNPATTGLHRPPYQYETPLGIFILQEKKPKMLYYKDGTTEIGGSAPYANRFSGGGYIHGIPVNLPSTAMVEYSQTLGTTQRSHMCVRNATSHAKFIYDWAPVDETIIVVIE